MRNHSKVIIASTLGTLIEFYDFALYGFFASIITQQFFPQHDPQSTLIMGYGVFAISFFARPIGALIIGLVGDTSGRRSALSYSILFIGIPTILLGFLPTYNEIGIYAPIALITLRFMQGVCTGGEYNGAFIFAFEHRQERQGYLGGLITASAASGMVLAIGSSLIVIRYFQPEIAWRIPFIIGGVIALLGYRLRQYILESPEFTAFTRSQNLEDRYKFFNVLQSSFTAFGMVFFIGAVSGALFYFQFIYLNGYCTKVLGMDTTDVTTVNTFSMIIYVMFLPLFGHLSDIYGHYKTIFLASIMACILVIPMYLIVAEATIWHLAFAQIVFSACTACFVAPSHIIMKNAFPVNVRYVAVSLSFSLGMCLLGGTTPLICSWLSQNVPLSLSPGFYIVAVCFVSAMFVRKYCEKNNKEFDGSSNESHHKESSSKAA